MFSCQAPKDLDPAESAAHGWKQLLGLCLNGQSAENGQRVGHNGIARVLRSSSLSSKASIQKALLHVPPNDLVDLTRSNALGASRDQRREDAPGLLAHHPPPVPWIGSEIREAKEAIDPCEHRTCWLSPKRTCTGQAANSWATDGK